jgi:DNA-binding protein HU-beta
VNRTELIEKVVDATSLDKKQAEAALSAFVDAVIGATRDGEKVSIFGFGSFVPKDRAAREGRNPQTGEKVSIAASKAVGFTPAAAFKETLNPKPAAKKVAGKKAAPAKKATKAAKK